VTLAVAAATAHDVFAANRAHGRVAFAVGRSAGATRRSHVHESGSLRVRFPGAPGDEIEAVLVNTAGGMAGGDRFDVEVAVGAGARLVLTTAAAEKVYRSDGPQTRVDVRIDLAEGGALAWLPQETILFDRARLSRRIAIELAPSAKLLLAEALVFGRSGMGEVVAQGQLFDRWQVRRGGRLMHVESTMLDGAIRERLAEAAVARGGVAVATVLVVPGDEAVVEAVRAHAGAFRGEVGASAWNGLAVARFCAHDGAALRHDLMLALAGLRGGALPRLWVN
jgi:urease accessory protein